MVQDLDVDTLKLLLDYLYLGIKPLLKGSLKKNRVFMGRLTIKGGKFLLNDMTILICPGKIRDTVEGLGAEQVYSNAHLI